MLTDAGAGAPHRFPVPDIGGIVLVLAAVLASGIAEAASSVVKVDAAAKLAVEKRCFEALLLL